MKSADKDKLQLSVSQSIIEFDAEFATSEPLLDDLGNLNSISTLI